MKIKVNKFIPWKIPLNIFIPEHSVCPCLQGVTQKLPHGSKLLPREFPSHCHPFQFLRLSLHRHIKQVLEIFLTPISHWFVQLNFQASHWLCLVSIKATPEKPWVYFQTKHNWRPFPKDALDQSPHFRRSEGLIVLTRAASCKLNAVPENGMANINFIKLWSLCRASKPQPPHRYWWICPSHFVAPSLHVQHPGQSLSLSPVTGLPAQLVFYLSK